MHPLLMELIQHQKLTKHASVIRKNNSLTSLLLEPLELSGSHPNLSLNQRVNLREQLNIQVKFLRSLKRRKLQLKNQPPLVLLKMKKQLLISKPPRLVLSNQLKKLTNSERLRSLKKKLLAQRLSLRRELSSIQCNSNLMSRKHQLNKHAKTQTRRVFLTKQDFKMSARE
jgi:hypothetical protein